MHSCQQRACPCMCASSVPMPMLTSLALRDSSRSPRQTALLPRGAPGRSSVGYRAGGDDMGVSEAHATPVACSLPCIQQQIHETAVTARACLFESRKGAEVGTRHGAPVCTIASKTSSATTAMMAAWWPIWRVASAAATADARPVSVAVMAHCIARGCRLRHSGTAWAQCSCHACRERPHPA